VDAAPDLVDGGQSEVVAIMPDAIAIRCGNGALDPLEECDDGNSVRGATAVARPVGSKSKRHVGWSARLVP